MALKRTRTEVARGKPLADLETDARGLAERLPELMVDAHRLAQTVVFGTHGRRRAGPGDTFWQFRQFQPSDARTEIDWRRSASSDHLFVREREWEAAHTAWLWADLSPSMGFRSGLAQTTKRDRALVLLMALAELLVEGGERVGYLDVLPPTANRRVVEQIALALATRDGNAANAESLPPPLHLRELSEVILFSDFLEPPAEIAERLKGLASRGIRGHLVEVLDPAEETLPFEGRAELIAVEGRERLLSERIEGLRPAYEQRLAAHRLELTDIARRLGWTFIRHRTDKPPGDTLLALHGMISGRLHWGYGQTAPSSDSAPVRPVPLAGGGA